MPVHTKEVEVVNFCGALFEHCFVEITKKSDLMALLKEGYGTLVKNPWKKYEECMAKYGDQSPGLDITPPNRFIRYATKQWYITNGYSPISIEKACAILRREYSLRNPRGKRARTSR